METRGALHKAGMDREKRGWIRRIMLALTVAVLAAASVINVASAYTNPITVPDSWYSYNDFYGEGDPYILKYKGMYYLYVSTADDKTGVKVWSSTDLVNWSYGGMCSTDPVTKAAYAPEVVYWNGYFYMYASPGGNGHYVLRSDSPTGPFTVQTGNTGNSIDGHVFIDDNGQWYFYRADNNGILAHAMSDPYSFGPASNTGANMNGWTEGPTVIKHDGKYYMTYTGNHVANPAYRIDYAVSSSPTSGFVPQAGQNPIIVSTEGTNLGLGHNGIVTGPDLDSQYMIYHSRTTPPGRRLNMDRIVWNGDKMITLGPTTSAQPNPAMPAFSDFFKRTSIGSGWLNVNGGTWGIYNQELMWQDTVGTTTGYRQVTTAATASNYTAEFNTKQVSQGVSANPLHGAVFSYTDENNYGIAVLSRNNNRLETNFRVNGVDQGWVTSALPAGYDYTKWHQIKVEKAGSTFKVYVDNMLKQTRTINGLNGGKVGYTTSDAHADFGYVAFSNHVNGDSAWDAYKPVPGVIEAVHYETGGEGVAYHETTANNIGGQYRDDAGDIRVNTEGGFNLGWNQTGEWYKYKVNVAANGTYDIDFRVATTFTNAQVRIWDGSTDLTGIINVPNTGSWDSWQTITKKGVNLTAGQRELRVEIVNGEFDFAWMRFQQSTAVTTLTDDFNDGNDNGWTRYEGNWAVSNNEYAASGSFGKSVIGSTGWADYTVQADIKLGSTSGDGGILLRVNNPADGLLFVNNPDNLQGYYAHLTTGGVHLGKFNFNFTYLTGQNGTYNVGTWYHMKAVVSGTNIKVYVGDMTTPKITYTDNSLSAFTHGKTGLRTFSNGARFDNFSVSP